MRHLRSLQSLERQQNIVALKFRPHKMEALAERGGPSFLSAQRELQLLQHLFDSLPLLVQFERRARQNQEIVGVTDQVNLCRAQADIEFVEVEIRQNGRKW